MRCLIPPIDTFEGVFQLCLSATARPEFKTRLASISVDLAEASANYHSSATNASLHLVPRLDSVGSVTKDELTGLYERHLSANNGAARAIYDRIRNSAPNNKCPLCGVGNVAHCDHHLPKGRYPNLSILPNNLVPACHFCNDKKRAKFPASAGQQTFHPYYDHHLLNSPWVKAILNPGPPPVLVFDTSPPLTWPDTDKERVQRHFEVCGLAITFTINANDEMPIVRDRLKLQYQRGGVTAVQQFLNDERDLYFSRPNSWQYATYCALASNNWFVNGGFDTIP